MVINSFFPLKRVRYIEEGMRPFQGISNPKRTAPNGIRLDRMFLQHTPGTRTVRLHVTEGVC